MKTPEQIRREVMDAAYGIGTQWEEPNDDGEAGFDRAQAESDIDADEIGQLIEQAIRIDRAQQAASSGCAQDADGWCPVHGADCADFHQWLCENANVEGAPGTPDELGVEPHVVLVGNPIDGMRLIGPFPDGTTAVDWASEHTDDDTWLSTALHTPDED